MLFWGAPLGTGPRLGLLPCSLFLHHQTHCIPMTFRHCSCEIGVSRLLHARSVWTLTDLQARVLDCERTEYLVLCVPALLGREGLKQTRMSKPQQRESSLPWPAGLKRVTSPPPCAFSSSCLSSEQDCSSWSFGSSHSQHFLDAQPSAMGLQGAGPSSFLPSLSRGLQRPVLYSGALPQEADVLLGLQLWGPLLCRSSSRRVVSSLPPAGAAGPAQGTARVLLSMARRRARSAAAGCLCSFTLVGAALLQNLCALLLQLQDLAFLGARLLALTRSCRRVMFPILLDSAAPPLPVLMEGRFQEALVRQLLIFQLSAPAPSAAGSAPAVWPAASAVAVLVLLHPVDLSARDAKDSRRCVRGAAGYRAPWSS